MPDADRPSSSSRPPRPPGRPVPPLPGRKYATSILRPNSEMPPPEEPPAGRRRFNRAGVALAFVIAIAMIPLTQHFQKQRTLGESQKQTTDYNIPAEKRQWRMRGVDGITEKQAVARFGTPLLARNFNVSDGAMAGPVVGLKHFYRKDAPDYEQRTREAPLTWEFPQYSVIREMIWQLSDSYLTIYLREPRAEVSLEGNGDTTQLTLPDAPEDGGDWIAIDNYRVGKDLFTPPAAASPTPAAK